MTAGETSITSYRFGSMVVGNHTYTSDLVIFDGKVYEGWRRKKGHRLRLKDLKEWHLKEAKHIIVGTGSFGVMKIDESLPDYCKKKNIQLETFPTGKAVERYNECRSEKKLLGAFHLTC